MSLGGARTVQQSHAGRHGQFGVDRRVESDRTWNIALDTDAWNPHVSGVVSAWPNTPREHALLGHRPQLIQSLQARGPFPPVEPDLVLCTEPFRQACSTREALSTDAMHIEPEGALGFAAGHIAPKRGSQFTIPYHYRFLQYVRAWFGLPAALPRAVTQWFHRPSLQLLVATEALKLNRGQVRAAVASRTWRAIAKDLLSFHAPLRAKRPTAASGRGRLAPAPAT
jgi:hypothetical protein